MQKLYVTERESERHLGNIEDSERHAATPQDRRDCERQPATMGDGERHAATPLERRDSERQTATMGDSERHTATLGETASDHIATLIDIELLL